MISVIANEADWPVVREFFELFKTPWRFYTPESNPVVLLCAGNVVPPADAALVIIYGSDLLEVDKLEGAGCESRTGPATFQHGDIEFPVYVRLLADAVSQKIVYRRGELNGRPYVRIGFDLFAEIRNLLANGQPANNAVVAALEQHIAVLRNVILNQGLPLVEIPPRPAGFDFIACLTHDVDHVGIRNHKFDHTMFGFLYRATAGSLLDVCAGKRNVGQLGRNIFAALRLPFVHLGLARDFWYQFDEYTALEEGRPSTFYVIPKKGEAGLDARGRRMQRRAASYDAAELKDFLRRLESAGKEVTVHGLDAWRDTSAGREERGLISGLVNNEAAGIRMHWLYFDAEAPGKLEAAGYDYDSTMGYNETIGYRAGTVQVFKPLTTQQLLELPMHIMDTALFYPSYLNLSDKQAESVIEPLLDNAVRFGGVLTVNWHDRSLAPERLWGEFYQKLIRQMQKRNAWFATAAQAVAWFRKRRAAQFEMTPAGTVKVTLPADSDEKLPALRITSQRSKDSTPVEETAYNGWEASLAA